MQHSSSIAMGLQCPVCRITRQLWNSDKSYTDCLLHRHLILNRSASRAAVHCVHVSLRFSVYVLWCLEFRAGAIESFTGFWFHTAFLLYKSRVSTLLSCFRFVSSSRCCI